MGEVSGSIIDVEIQPTVQAAQDQVQIAVGIVSPAVTAPPLQNIEAHG